MLHQLAATIRSEGRAMPHLSNQQREILLALRERGSLTTGECWDLLRISTLSQRGGPLVRMGLAVKEHVKVESSDGKPSIVVRMKLTDLGRTINLDPAPPSTEGPVTGLKTPPAERPGEPAIRQMTTAARVSGQPSGDEKSRGGAEMACRSTGRRVKDMDDAQTSIPVPVARQARRIVDDLFAGKGLSR